MEGGKRLPYLNYKEIIASKVFKSSSYVITYLLGNVLWLLKNNFQVYFANNIDWENSHPENENWGDCRWFLSYGDFLYLWFLYENIFFGPSILCIQGLNKSKAFDQTTHKKTYFLYSLTWPGFKSLPIAGNHIQLNTILYFFVPGFLMALYLILLSLQKRRKDLYSNTSTV